MALDIDDFDRADMFAAFAMHAMVAQPNRAGFEKTDGLADEAYLIAMAMLEARKKLNPPT